MPGVRDIDTRSAAARLCASLQTTVPTTFSTNPVISGFVGVKLFRDPNTKSDHGELLRTIGFSSAPGLIRVFGVTPELMTVTFIGSAFWMLACMVVAVKSALDYESLWKAFGVVVVSWLFQAFFLFLIIVLFKGF